MSTKPYFSLIIPTRDRPVLFERALESALKQDFDALEVIVVVDGSSPENLEKYGQLEERYPQVTFLYLVHRSNGHGQSYAMNYGVTRSSGDYICFLDDDDEFIDFDYLSRARNSIQASSHTIDSHYSHQKAVFANGEPQTKRVWLESLIPKLSARERNTEDTFFIDTDFLLSAKGFGHLNCGIIRRGFFDELKGLDENLRYENDRDFFIRCIDNAQYMLMSDKHIALHHIPDAAKKDNMSTAASYIDKKLYQLTIYDKGISKSKTTSMQSFCRKAKTYEQKHLATALEKIDDFAGAKHFAKEALANGFTFGWLAYTLSLYVKPLLPRQANRGKGL